MTFEILPDLGSSVICCSVDEEDYPLEAVSLGVCHDVVQMFSELDVPSAREAVPHYSLLRPEEGNETVQSFCVAECWDMQNVALFRPTALDSR